NISVFSACLRATCLCCLHSALSPCRSCLFFFFFQAEDGIRDFHVTGVQTCALPIYIRVLFLPSLKQEYSFSDGFKATKIAKPGRSEERRVGKECRSRWAPDQ